MDYSRFRFRAVIDWIEIVVCTSNPTNFHTLQRLLNLVLETPAGKNIWVESIDAGAGGAASKFRIRFHDPKNWNSIHKSLTELSIDKPFAESPRVAAIEVSLDAYSNGASQDELIELTANFYKFMANPVSTNRRFSGVYKGGVDGMATHIQTLRMIKAGRNIAIGNIKDPLYQQIYFKRTDDGGKPISQNEHRARCEVKLQGEALPFQQLSDLKNFAFTKLAHHFKFRKLTSDLSETVLVAMRDGRNQMGERKTRARTEFSKLAPADIALNQRAYDSLRELTRRMRS